MLRHLGAGIAFAMMLSFADAKAAESIGVDQLESICLVTSADHDASRRFDKCETLIAHVRGKLKTGDIHGMRACIPENASSVYLVIVGMAWLEKNPTPPEEEAHVSLARAYVQRWPCP
tara:strand:- start:285 stop:638 length:354 start_codon:yes stop_codon:yes gene_type:complete